MFKRELKGKQKQEVLADIKSLDFYKTYKNSYMKIKNRLIPDTSPYFLTKTKYMEIINDFNILLRDSTLEGKTVTLPLNLGNIGIRKYKYRIKVVKGKVFNLAADWKSTLELWENDESAYKNKTVIRHLNKDTNGFISKIDWIKSTCKVKNKSRYKFIACRTFKRMLKDVLRDEHSTIDFLEYGNGK